MSIEDEARAEVQVGDVFAVQVTVIGVNREYDWANVRFKSNELGTLKISTDLTHPAEASRKPESASPDTEREVLALTLATALAEWRDKALWKSGDADSNAHHAADAILAAGFSRASQPVQVEVTAAQPCPWSRSLDHPFSGTTGCTKLAGHEPPHVDYLGDEYTSQPVQVEVTDEDRLRAVEAVADLRGMATQGHMLLSSAQIVDAALTALGGGDHE